MGEIAELMIEGHMCSWCGICFEEAHGYPVLCSSCSEEYEEENLLREYGLQKAFIEEL